MLKLPLIYFCIIFLGRHLIPGLDGRHTSPRSRCFLLAPAPGIAGAVADGPGLKLGRKGRRNAGVALPRTSTGVGRGDDYDVCLTLEQHPSAFDTPGAAAVKYTVLFWTHQRALEPRTENH